MALFETKVKFPPMYEKQMQHAAMIAGLLVDVAHEMCVAKSDKLGPPGADAQNVLAVTNALATTLASVMAAGGPSK